MLANGSLDIRTHSWFEPYNFDNILNLVVQPPHKPVLKSDTDLTLFKKVEPTECDKFMLPAGTKNPFAEF